MATQPLQLRVINKRAKPSPYARYYKKISCKMARKLTPKREFRLLLSRATARYFFKGF